MPSAKKPQTFDEHVGSVVGGLARAHGGRPFLMALLDLSKGTVDRRVAGSHGFTVKELEIMADALNTTMQAIVDQALRNYGGTEEAGLQKLIEESNVELVDDPVSQPPVSLSERRKKTPAEMTESEMEDERSAANIDPEYLEDESDAP